MARGVHGQCYPRGKAGLGRSQRWPCAGPSALAAGSHFPDRIPPPVELPLRRAPRLPLRLLPRTSLPGADSHQLPLGCFWPSVSVARGSASSESIGSSVQFPPYFRAPPDTHTPCLYVPVGYTKNHWPPRVPGPCCWALRDVGGGSPWGTRALLKPVADSEPIHSQVGVGGSLGQEGGDLEPHLGAALPNPDKAGSSRQPDLAGVSGQTAMQGHPHTSAPQAPVARILPAR